MADLDVAGVSARLGFDVDETGANRFEAKLKRLETETAKPIKAELGADLDDKAFALYDAKLKEAEAKSQAKDRFKAKLGADFDSRSFNAAMRQLLAEQKAGEAAQVRQHAQTASEMTRIDAQNARQTSRTQALAVEEQLKIDAQRVRAQIANDSLIQRERIKSDADAARSAARRAEADEAAAKRSIQAADDVGRAFTQAGGSGGGGRSGLGSLLSSLGPESNQSVNGLRQLGIAMRLIRTTGLVEGLGAAIQALSTFAAGAVAAASALAPLTGLLGTIPNFTSAAAQALGTVGLAAQGVGAAVTAGLNAQARAGQDAVTSGSRQKSAAESLHNANRTLAQDQQTATENQNALNEAREQATRDLEDLKNASQEAGTSERAAALELQRARQDLTKAQQDPNAGALGVHEAENRLQQAKDNLHDVQLQASRARQDYADAQKKGVEGSDKVVQANKQIKDSAEAATEASHDVGVAQAGVATAADKGTSAMNTYEAKLKGLAPAQADFVKYLVKENSVYTELQQAAGQKLFTGVESGVKSAMQNFGVFREGVIATSDTLGKFVAKLGDFLGSKGFGKDLGTIMGRNNIIIREVGDGLLNLFKATVDVTVASGDLTNSIGKTVLGWTKYIEQQAKAGRDNGTLKNFFKETEGVVKELISILKDLGIAFYNIGRDAHPLGADLLQIMTNNAKVFKDWTASAKGENSIKNYFTNARPALLDFGGLLEDTTKAFFSLGDGRKLTPLIDAIREDLIPALQSIIDNASTSFGPAFVKAISQIILIFEKLTGNNGPLVVFANLLNTTLTLVNEIIDKIPAIGTAIGALVVAGGLVKALRLASAITGMGALVKLLRQARDIAATTTLAPSVTGGGGATGTIAGDVAGGVVARGGGATSGGAGGVVRTAEGVFIAGPAYEDARRGRLAAARAAATPAEEAVVGRGARVAAGARTAASTAGRGARALSTAAIGTDATAFLSKVGGPAAAVVALLTYMTAPGNPVQKAQKTLSNFTFGLVPDPLSGSRQRQAQANAAVAQRGGQNLLTNAVNLTNAAPVTYAQQYRTGVASGLIPAGQRGDTARGVAIPTTSVDDISKAFNNLINGKKDAGSLDIIASVLHESLDTVQKLDKSSLQGLANQFGKLKPQIKAIHDQLGQFPNALKQIRAQDVIDPNAAAQVFSNFNKIRKYGVDSVSDLQKNIKFNIDEIGKAFEQGTPSWAESMSKNITVGVDAVKKAMKDGAISTKDGTEQINSLVKQNMTLVRNNLSSFSAQGKDALAKNFSDAADAVKAQMDRTGKVTKEGLTQIRQYLTDEMKVYGFSVSEAKNIVAGQSYIGGPEEGSAGPTGTGVQPRAKAGGGMANPYSGSAADDHVLLDPTGRPVAALSGTEGIINEPQMGIIDYALGMAQSMGGLPWGSLDQLWGSGMRHYATGGMLQLPANFVSTHDTDGLPGYPAIDVFGKPGERVGAPIGGQVTRFSGHPPSAGAVQGAGGPFGWSIYMNGDNKASYFMTHFGSRAIKVGQRVSKGQNIGTIGDYPGTDADHIHEGKHDGLVGGVVASSATSSGATVKKIPQPKVLHGGAVGQTANKVLKIATGAANSVLSAAASQGGGAQGDFTGDGMSVHADPRVVAAFRRAIQVKKANPVERLSLWEAGIVESGLQNLPGGDRDSEGPLQQRPSQGWKNATNPLLGAEDYLSQAEAKRPWRGTAGQLAQSVQRSGFPLRYDQVAAQARKFLGRGGRAMRRAVGGSIRKYAGGGQIVSSSSSPGTKNPYTLGTLRKVTGDNITVYNTVQTQLDTLQKQYTQKDRAYGQSEEVYINPQTGEVNVSEVKERVNELNDLYNLRIQIWHKLEEAYAIVQRIINSYDTIITNLTNSLKHAKKKDRSGIQASITHYKANMKNWQSIFADLPFDIEDARLDVLDIAAERSSVANTLPDPSLQDAYDQSIKDSQQAQAGDDTAGTLTPDQQALLDQATNLKNIVNYGDYVQSSSDTVLGGIGNANTVGQYGGPGLAAHSPQLVAKANAMGVSLSGGGASPSIVINNNISSLTPSDPAVLKQVGKTVTSGLGYQGSRPSTRTTVGA